MIPVRGNGASYGRISLSFWCRDGDGERERRERRESGMPGLENTSGEVASLKTTSQQTDRPTDRRQQRSAKIAFHVPRAVGTLPRVPLSLKRRQPLGDKSSAVPHPLLPQIQLYRPDSFH